MCVLDLCGEFFFGAYPFTSSIFTLVITTRLCGRSERSRGTSGTLLPTLLHIGAKKSVDAGLIAGPLASVPLEHVAIYPQRQ